MHAPVDGLHPSWTQAHERYYEQAQWIENPEVWELKWVRE